jgi:hypothetical protein
MRARLAFATVAALTCITGTAVADLYAAGPVYGGNPTGGIVTCRVLNAGTNSVSITARQIITNTNAFIAPTADSCNVAVLGGRTCAYSAPVGGNFALACRLVVTGTDPQISGSIDVQNPVGTVRVVESLQPQ